MKTLPKTSAVCANAACVAVLAVAVLTVACAPAPEPVVEAPPPGSELSVGEAWARAADSGAMTAVYFSVANSGTVADTLNAVRSDAAEDVGLHMSMQHEGTMSMAALRALPVPAQDSLLFRPLGAHVMLTRVSRPLVAGDTVRVFVDFVSGKSLEVRAVVRTP